MSLSSNVRRNELRRRTKELKQLKRNAVLAQKRFDKLREQAVKIEQRTEAQKAWFLLGRDAFDKYHPRDFRLAASNTRLALKRWSRALWLAGYDTAKNPSLGDAIMYEEMGWIPKP